MTRCWAVRQVHGAVCATDGTAPDEFLDVTLNGVWTGWSGFTTMFSNSHHAAIQSKTAPGNTEGWESHKLSVVCFKLSTLLARQQVTHVDYMAVSAQGGELQVRCLPFVATSLSLLWLGGFQSLCA